MSVGFGLLKALVRTNAPMHSLDDYGISRDFFYDSEQATYDFLVQHLLQFGAYPSETTISAEMREDVFRGLPDEPVEFWTTRVANRHIQRTISRGLSQINSLNQASSPNDAVAEVSSLYRILSELSGTSGLVPIQVLCREALERHGDLQMGRAAPGIPFGFPYLDSKSGGAQPGDTIAVAGDTGVGKSHLMQTMALHSLSLGKRVLYASPEIPRMQLSRRFLASSARLPSDSLKHGRLSHWAVERAREDVQAMSSFEGQLSLIRGGLRLSIDQIEMIASQWRPDVLYIDGAYLLQVSSRRELPWWERYMLVAERSKTLATSLEIPVVGSYQFNRNREGQLHGLKGGSALEQLASMVLSFEWERMEDKRFAPPVQRRLLRLLKGRDGESGVIRVRMDFRTSSMVEEAVVAGFLDDTIGDPHEDEMSEEILQEFGDSVEYSSI